MRSVLVSKFLILLVTLGLVAVSCDKDLGLRNSFDQPSPGPLPTGKNDNHDDDGNDEKPLDKESQWYEYSVLLRKYVQKGTRKVFYKVWKDNKEDHESLKKIIGQLADFDIENISINEKKTFFFNAYNMITLDVILSNYEDTTGDNWPGRSIRNIKNLDFDIWDDPLSQRVVAGKKRSLNEIEHGILRKMDDLDARLHVALNCASIGCPNLGREAFEAKNLDQILDDASRSFVSNSKYVFFDFNKNEIRTTQLLKWYKKDFKKDKRFGSVLGFLKEFAPEKVKEKGIESFKLKNGKIKYNWGLNEATGDPE